MLDKLIYRRMVVVSGTVHPPDDELGAGAGVTLMLANRRGHVTEQITVWESEFDLKPAASATVKDSVRYERLILPAPVWLGYQERFGYKADKPPLQTRNWRSYALFVLGELKPDADARRRLYEQALDRDPCNLGARLNLATMLLTRPQYAVPPVQAVPDDGRRETWAERLAEADEHLKVVALATNPADDAIWYRARYAQAARYIYLAQGADATQNARRAASCLAEIVTETANHGDDPRLEALLITMAAPVAVLQRVATLIANGAPSPAVPNPSRWVSASAEYNAAGLWARWADATEVDSECDQRTPACGAAPAARHPSHGLGALRRQHRPRLRCDQGRSGVRRDPGRGSNAAHSGGPSARRGHGRRWCVAHRARRAVPAARRLAGTARLAWRRGLSVQLAQRGRDPVAGGSMGDPRCHPADGGWFSVSLSPRGPSDATLRQRPLHCARWVVHSGRLTAMARASAAGGVGLPEKERQC
jgi:hypothetical protein